MTNRDIEAAWHYHNLTKHSLERLRTSRFTLDWANQPRPYKLYVDVPSLPLPRDLPESGTPALEAIADTGAGAAPDRVLSLPLLASLLHYTAGITRRLRFPGGTMDFRAASCTGALYHIEFYVVCGPLEGLEAGVYQFGVHDFALHRLRTGDFRGALAEASGFEPAVSEAQAVLVGTSTYWRNAWKYQERTYRHCFWDLGTCLANLLAMAAAHRLAARVVLGFVDRDVNRVLDVDGEREAALALIPIGRGSPAPPAPASIPILGLPTVPLSPREIDYPAIRAIHAASSLTSPREVVEWRQSAQAGPGEAHPPGSAPPGDAPEARPHERSAAPALVPLPPGLPTPLPREPVEAVIRRRGSSRRFRRQPITLAQLGTMLHRTTRGIPADFLRPSGLTWNEAYLIVHAVDGLPSGRYVLDQPAHRLISLGTGYFRDHAGYLALNQELAADAAVNVYFLADLTTALHRMGNRGYRAAQLEASITAGKLYLAAYALGLGATGLTFFDDDVTDFFLPHALGKSVMFLIAIGHPGRPPQLLR